jgi:AhpD family alkylhydroperoxidase
MDNRMNSAGFNKRIYSLPSFNTAVDEVFGNIEALKSAARGGRVSQAFAEKIMLAVTRVNGCRYCSFAHSRAALAAGVPESELRKLMAGEWRDFPQDEVVALTFAQHYAETQCQPDPAAWQRVVDYYGEDMARDILAYLRMITFGNLYGNTFDALLSRFRGKPAAQSSLWDELGVILGAAVLVPSRLLRRLARGQSAELVERSDL